MFRSLLKEVKEENILPGRGKPWKGKGHESLQCTQGTKRNVIRSEGSEVHREEEGRREAQRAADISQKPCVPG